MRARILVGCFLATALIGCSGVQHQHQPYHAAGMPLPIEVTVKHKPDQQVHGTVYHRTPHAGQYSSTSMQLRSNQLWAMLPTAQMAPNDMLEYYIDVNKDGKMMGLGSPGTPYVVTMLDPTGMILAELTDRPYATDDEHPVRIVLHANNEPIDQPSLLYQMPGLPGDVRAPMETNGRGDYQVMIPPFAVRAGTWRYAIEVPINGDVHRMPQQGYRTFVVKPAYHPPVATGATDAPPTP